MIKIEKFLDYKQREEIGYAYIGEKLKIQSLYGQDLFNSLTPFTNEKELENELNKIEVIIEYITNFTNQFKQSEIFFKRFKNIDSIVDNLDFIILDEVDIFEIKKFIFNINKLEELFSVIEKPIKEFVFFDYQPLFSYLDQDNSKMSFFHLYDSYSKILEDLRVKYKQEDDEDIKADLKEKIKEEELAVKTNITKEIAKYQHELKESTKQIAYLDLLIAKAKIAKEFNLSKPTIGKEIILENAYNPMIKELVKNNGYEYKNMNIEIERNVTLLTGSNMSGKSVSLKNMLLNILLFQLGFYPFAEKASMPLLDYILYVSDELQDVKNSLSSFGMEVFILNQAIEIINKNQMGFIALDEYARGTNPVEAKKIVTGLIKYLKEKQVYAILSTHLDLSLDFDYIHYQVKGLDDCKEVCLNSEEIQRVMDYSLIRVNKEKSVPYDAFKVMNFLNMDEHLKQYIENEYEKGE